MTTEDDVPTLGDLERGEDTTTQPNSYIIGSWEMIGVLKEIKAMTRELGRTWKRGGQYCR
jgi:hypothetical protein